MTRVAALLTVYRHEVFVRRAAVLLIAVFGASGVVMVETDQMDEIDHLGQNR